MFVGSMFFVAAAVGFGRYHHWVFLSLLRCPGLCRRLEEHVRTEEYTE